MIRVEVDIGCQPEVRMSGWVARAVESEGERTRCGSWREFSFSGQLQAMRWCKPGLVDLSLAASGSQLADAGGLPIATGTQGDSTDGSSTDGGKGSTAGGNEYASGGRAVMRARLLRWRSCGSAKRS